MRGDDLIQALAADLRPVRTVASPLVSTGLWLAGALAILTAGTSMSRMRPDLVPWLSRGDTLMEVGIAALTALLAAFAAFQLAIPGRARLWALPAVAGGAAWLAVLGVGCWHDLRTPGAAGITAEASLPCLIFIAGFGTPVLLLTLFLARHAFLSRPLPVALLAGLAASGMADAGMVLVDHPHAAATTLVWHGGAVLVLLGIAALAGPGWMRRTTRWFRRR